MPPLNLHTIHLSLTDNSFIFIMGHEKIQNLPIDAAKNLLHLEQLLPKEKTVL